MNLDLVNGKYGNAFLFQLIATNVYQTSFTVSKSIVNPQTN